MVSTEKCYLKWNSFLENVITNFEDLTHNQDFSDVTLVCEDNQQIMAHRVILSASSPILQQMLKNLNHSHPLLYFWDIKHRDLVKLVEFMYSGQASVYQSELPDFLKIAKKLGVKGVSEHTLQEKKNPLEDSLVILDQQILPNILQSPKKEIPSEEMYGLADSYPDNFRKNTGEMFVPESLEHFQGNHNEANDRHQDELYKEVHTKETLHHIRKPQHEYGEFVNKPKYKPEINGDRFNENKIYNKLERPHERSVPHNLGKTQNKYTLSEEPKEATTLRHEQEFKGNLFKKEDVWQKQQKGAGLQEEEPPISYSDMAILDINKPTRRKRKSVLWMFYDTLEGDVSTVQCRNCATKISRGPKDQTRGRLGNGSMLPHLKKHHADDYQKYVEIKQIKDADEETYFGQQINTSTLQYKENKVEGQSESTALSFDESPRNDFLSKEILGATNFIQERELQTQEQRGNIRIDLGIQDEQIPNLPNMSNSNKGQIKRRKRKSVIWLFYKTLEGDMSKVKCNKCARIISRGRKNQKLGMLGNGGMSPHLRIHHPYEYKKYLIAKESKDTKEAQEAEEAKQKNNKTTMVGPKIEATHTRPIFDVLQYYEEDPTSKLLLACQVGHCTEKFVKNMSLEALKAHLYSHWNVR